ncbi:hypothetical protein [Acinetobacter guillouiae]|uniref:hypothetical protein n=1 Tax=Acinetobacter guillouiae TaxID=106649 RepID=UPI0005A61924|nr:hypothetical protein [Acinetobacter guillouiae]
MAEIITKQKLVEANENASAWEKYWAGGDDEDVITRLNKLYPTHAKALKILMENGGIQPFETQAQLLASTPIVDPTAAKALDTKKVWLWKNGTWTDTGLSEKDQAVGYVNSLIPSIKELYNPSNNVTNLFVNASESGSEFPPGAILSGSDQRKINVFEVDSGGTYTINCNDFNPLLLQLLPVRQTQRHQEKPKVK